MRRKQTTPKNAVGTAGQKNAPRYSTPAVRREDVARYEQTQARKKRDDLPPPVRRVQQDAPLPVSGYRPPADPQKRKKKNRRARGSSGIIIALSVCAAAIAIVLGVRFFDYWQAQREYAQYAQLAMESTPTHTTPVLEPPRETPTPTMARDAAAKQPAPPSAAPTVTPKPFFSETVRKFSTQNDDAVAYLDVPGTKIQYPVVQGKDNEYYVTHTFAKKRRAAGAIFVDAWNNSDFSDFNTVIYGHNMKDGSMFSGLREYRHASFLRDHKYIEVTLLHSKRIYKVFAAYLVEDTFDFRGFTHTSLGSRIGFVRDLEARSEIKTNTEATGSDTLLTLVTCATEERDWYWVVHAVLTEVITTAGQ